MAEAHGSPLYCVAKSIRDQSYFFSLTRLWKEHELPFLQGNLELRPFLRLYEYEPQERSPWRPDLSRLGIVGVTMQEERGLEQPVGVSDPECVAWGLSSERGFCSEPTSPASNTGAFCGSALWVAS